MTEFKVGDRVEEGGGAMRKKYELTDETMTIYGVTLHRIRALRDFAGVNKGELGGWVEKESNLSHEGDCWVSGEAVVCGEALVYGAAQVFGKARVSGEAWVCGEALVYGAAQVFEETRVYEEARVSGAARVYGKARVSGAARVSGKAYLHFESGITPNVSSGDLWLNADGTETLRLGCWEGTLAQLREMVGSNSWPSGGDEQYRARWSSSLLAVADLCQAHLDAWNPTEPTHQHIAGGRFCSECGEAVGR